MVWESFLLPAMVLKSFSLYSNRLTKLVGAQACNQEYRCEIIGVAAFHWRPSLSFSNSRTTSTYSRESNCTLSKYLIYHYLLLTLIYFDFCCPPTASTVIQKYIYYYCLLKFGFYITSNLTNMMPQIIISSLFLSTILMYILLSVHP